MFAFRTAGKCALRAVLTHDQNRLHRLTPNVPTVDWSVNLSYLYAAYKSVRLDSR